MKRFNAMLDTLDRIQQKTAWIGFPLAIIKKYSEDQMGYQAALLTYYGFLSLFPLLLVLITLLGIASSPHSSFQTTIIHSLTNYFPVIGAQLSAHIHSLHKNGIALLVGLLLIIYGSHGVADVFRHGINQIWRIPSRERDGFPKTFLKSLLIIGMSGLGFAVASLLAGYAGAVGKGIVFRLLYLLVNVVILYWLFGFLIRISLPRPIPKREVRTGAVIAAIGLVILQSVGTYVLKIELKHLDALYSSFALALGLIFWLYLQIQVFYYAAEAGFVRARHLWPRPLRQSTPPDEVLK